MKTLPLLLVLFLTACATPQKLNTASGRPEVIVHSSTKHVRTVVVNDFVDRQWTPVKTEGMQLLFEKRGSASQDFMMGLLTNQPNSTIQLTITLVENDKDVRVLGGLNILGQNAFGRQTNVEWSGAYRDLQRALDMIKSKAES